MHSDFTPVHRKMQLALLLTWAPTLVPCHPFPIGEMPPSSALSHEHPHFVPRHPFPMGEMPPSSALSHDHPHLYHFTRFPSVRCLLHRLSYMTTHTCTTSPVSHRWYASFIGSLAWPPTLVPHHWFPIGEMPPLSALDLPLAAVTESVFPPHHHSLGLLFSILGTSVLRPGVAA